jgi:hypothetical protein
MYKVQLVDERGHYLKSPLYAVDRWVQKGDPIGFDRTEDGKLLAVAGPQQVELNALPPTATHVMWYHKSKQPTQFAKSSQKFGAATAQTAALVAAGAGIAGAVIIWLWANSDDDCNDACRVKEHRHRH